MTKAELNEKIVRYATANEQKNAVAAEVKDLGDEIKEYMEDREVTTIEAMGYTAVISIRNGKKINLEKVAELLGGEIPAECFEATQTVVLNVKPAKAAKGKPAPKTAVVAVAAAA